MVRLNRITRSPTCRHADFLKHQFLALIYWGGGCDKLMFGTNWLLMAMPPYLEFVRRCEFLSGDERQRVLHDSPLRLYWR